MDEQKKKEMLAALAGAQQGTTLGLADEIGGLSGALGSKFGGDERDFSELYKEARDENRSEYKQKEEESPKAFLAGEVGSAFLTPAALRGAAGMVGSSAASSIGRSQESDPKLLALEAIKGGARSALMNKLGGSLMSRMAKPGSVGSIAKEIEESAPEKLATLTNPLGKPYKALRGPVDASVLPDNYLKTAEQTVTPKFSALGDMIKATNRKLAPIEGISQSAEEKAASSIIPKIIDKAKDTLSEVPENITQSFINKLDRKGLNKLYDQLIEKGNFDKPTMDAIVNRLAKVK